MKPSTLLLTLLTSALPQTSLAQQQQDQQQNGPSKTDLATSTITMLDASSSTLIATVTLLNKAASPAEPTRTTSTQATTSSPPADEPAAAITSVIQATRTETGYTRPSATSNLNADGIDVEAGASGSSAGGFSLSEGGMIAVIVVVVCVAVFGVLSITLFILAKKRQWRVRESIKRASRRLTGRAPPASRRSEVDRRKRSGVVAGAARKAGGQKGAAAVSATEMADLEKGRGGAPWLGRMKGNDWR